MGVAAVDDADHVTAGDLREDSGDKALAHVVSGQAGGSAIHARLRPAGNGGEVGFVVGGLAEDAEEGGGRLYGGESLAADVADDNAESVRGGEGLVQVTADACFGGGGQVEGFNQKWADAVRDRAQQDMLRDLGHEAHVGEGTFPARAVGSQECSEDADHSGAQVGGHVVALPHVAHRAARAARGAARTPSKAIANTVTPATAAGPWAKAVITGRAMSRKLTGHCTGVTGSSTRMPAT